MKGQKAVELIHQNMQNAILHKIEPYREII